MLTASAVLQRQRDRREAEHLTAFRSSSQTLSATHLLNTNTNGIQAASSSLPAD